MIGLLIAGLFATSLFTFLILSINGMSLAEIMRASESGMRDVTPMITRVLIMTQHLCMFILPATVFGLIYYKPDLFQNFNLKKSPSLPIIFLGIFFLLVAYPLVNVGLLLNDALPLPLWAKELEQQAADTLHAVLAMDSFLIFLLNMLLISIIPGIGEELVFRGIFQKHLGGWLKNPIAGLWISALLFSAMHMQFEGLIPRFILGVVLGYLYYWTRNLWVPIIAHAFNNGMQVIAIYAFGLDLETVDQEGSEHLTWWMIVLSVTAMFGIAQLISKYRDQ